jgi:hypothetical protein
MARVAASVLRFRASFQHGRIEVTKRLESNEVPRSTDPLLRVAVSLSSLNFPVKSPHDSPSSAKLLIAFQASR